MYSWIELTENVSLVFPKIMLIEVILFSLLFAFIFISGLEEKKKNKLMKVVCGLFLIYIAFKLDVGCSSLLEPQHGDTIF